MFPSLLNVVLAAVFVAWTLLLTYRAMRRREKGALAFLIASLGIVAVSRVLYIAEVEPDPDTSTWIAAATTVVQRADTWWTLLTFSDSRPLTVLPLVLALEMGAPPTYVMSELVGLSCWMATIVICYHLLRLQVSASASLLACWTLALFIGTTGYRDHIAYNSECLAIVLLALTTHLALWLTGRTSIRALSAGALGVLLGLFPFEKMQIVPAGVVLAAFVGVHLIRLRAWSAAGALIVGGLIPAIAVTSYYAWQNEWSSFWDTYFWRYYYYSFSEEVSPMPLTFRFRPGRAARFILGNEFSAFYLGAMAVVIAVGWMAIRQSQKLEVASSNRRHLVLTSILLLTMIHAVLQSGNNHQHYVLLLFVPLLHAACSVLAITPAPWRQRLVTFGLGMAALQGAANAWVREPLPASRTADADERITRLIRAHSAPGDPILVWGYADRFHVLANRPMAHRYANTFYIYSPISALKELDLRHFTEDLERNRPALFVDAMLPDISVFGQMRFRHDHHPVVASYVARNYEQVATTDGVRVYVRNDPLRLASSLNSASAP